MQVSLTLVVCCFAACLLAMRSYCNRLIATVDRQVVRLDKLAAARSRIQAELDAARAKLATVRSELEAESEFEVRDDGKTVRRDRWKTGMQNVSTILVGSRAGYEIDDIVDKVRVLAETCRADYESGGDGTPWSAPLRAPCPAHCDDGMQGREECGVCDGYGTVIVPDAGPVGDQP